MNRTLAIVTSTTALVLFVASSWAERYHSRRYREHMDTVHALEDAHEVSQEVGRFATDRRLDYAEMLFQWGYHIAAALWILTAVLIMEGMI